METWYGSLNIDGLQVFATSGDRLHVFMETSHYYYMYTEEIENAEKRVTMTIRKGKKNE